MGATCSKAQIQDVLDTKENPNEGTLRDDFELRDPQGNGNEQFEQQETEKEPQYTEEKRNGYHHPDQTTTILANLNDSQADDLGEYRHPDM